MRRRKHAGMTRIEWVVMLLIAMLTTALLLPSIARIRENARTITCSGQLKQIGTALANYESTSRVLPAGWRATNYAPESGLFYGWQASLLSYMDLSTSIPTIDFSLAPVSKESLNSAAENFEKVAGAEISIYRCPSDTMLPRNPLRSGYATSNYSAIFGSRPLPRVLPDRMGLWMPGAAPTPSSSDGCFYANSQISLGDITDGVSNTMVVGERSLVSGSGIWLGVVQNQFENDQVTDCSYRSPINKAYSSLSSAHPGGVQVLLMDGSVRFIDESIESSTDYHNQGAFQSLCSRDDGQSSSNVKASD